MAASNARSPFRNVLIATDGSAHSAAAVAAGLQLAHAVDASVTLVHATPPFESASMSAHGALRALRTHAEAVQQDAAAAFDAPTAEARKLGLRCDAIHRTDAEPWRAIVDVAAERGCDLIVMASHGRRGIDALIMGSETAKVLTHTRVPVLVYR